ncbi:MAG: hypothetical protein ACTSXD_13740 [Candidatus Heimdallarchaeaceae archaeon]
MKFKKTLLSLLLAGSLMLPKVAKSVNIRGFFINSPNCSTKVWRVNPPDTLRTITNSVGRWAIETDNFNPPAQIGDTLYIEGGWNLGGSAKTIWELKATGNMVYDLNLDMFTGCIEEINDTSGLHDTIPLMCEYYIDGFAPETTQIDTANSPYCYYDLHAAFENSQAQPGAWAHYKLYKYVQDSPDTLYQTIDSFIINRDAFDAQLIKQTEYFPKEKVIIGVEENKQEVPKEKERKVKQTLGTVFDIKGSWTLYNLIGNKVAEYHSYNDQFVRHNFGSGKNSLPQGIYLLKKEEDGRDLRDLIEKIIILR